MSVVAEADDRGAAAAPGGRPRRADRLRPADALDGVVGAAPAGERADLLGQVGRRRAGRRSRRPPGQLLLRRGRIDRDDRRAAPAIRAACSAARPTPPRPKTTTDSPGRTRAVLSDRAEAGEHGAAEQRRLGRAGGRRGRGMHAFAATTVSLGERGRRRGPGTPARPSAVRRTAGHARRSACCAQVRLAVVAEPARPARRRPVEHDAVARRRRGRRPRRPRRPCPRPRGRGRRERLASACRRPGTGRSGRPRRRARRTRTCPGPGSGSAISSTDIAPPGSRSTAATTVVMGAAVVRGRMPSGRGSCGLSRPMPSDRVELLVARGLRASGRGSCSDFTSGTRPGRARRARGRCPTACSRRTGRAG